MSETVLSLEQKQECVDAIIRKHGGKASVDDIIEEARAHDHPLHDWFQWDDTAAGIEHRRWQCRQLLSRIRYVHTTVTGVVIKAVAYVHDVNSSGVGGGYIAVDAIEPNSRQAKDQLLSELNRIEALVQRALALAEEWGLSEDFNGILTHVQGVSATLRKKFPGKTGAKAG
jgi:hypothetical protein